MYAKHVKFNENGFVTIKLSTLIAITKSKQMSCVSISMVLCWRFVHSQQNFSLIPRSTSYASALERLLCVLSHHQRYYLPPGTALSCCSSIRTCWCCCDDDALDLESFCTDADLDLSVP